MEMTKGQRNRLQWNPQAILVCKQVKTALCQHPVLYTLDLEKVFFL